MPKTVLSYPFSDPRDFEKLKAGWLRRLVARYETLRVSKRKLQETSEIDVALISPTEWRGLSTDDVPLIFLCHNNLDLLPSYLSHYRSLGVTRFICLDDQSTDGSREWLVQQADVDLWRSSVRYREARRGRVWREKLFEKYGRGRWYLNLDADEFLIYQDCDARPLKELVASLQSRGITRLAAPMIDFYGPPTVEGASSIVGDETPPWVQAPFFDCAGYTISLKKRSLGMRGGIRAERFGGEVELMKYPLLFWGDRCGYPSSIHQPTPFEDNFVPLYGVLMHFKFFADYRTKFEQAVLDKQYFDDAREYKRIIDVLDHDGGINFATDHTRKFVGANQLMKLGFFLPVWPSAAVD